MVTRLSQLSTRLSSHHILPQAAGQGGLPVRVDHIAFETFQAVDELDAAGAHGERGRGVAVSLVNIGSHHGQANNAAVQRARLPRPVYMLAAHIAAGGSHTP